MPITFTAHTHLRALALTCLAHAACAHPLPPATVTAATQTPAPAPPRCEVGAPAAALPEVDSATLLEQVGSSVEPYELTAGLWLEGQPILVNGPYDFAMAMTMQGIGPAIAAGQRKEANETMAATLSSVALSPELHDKLAALKACGLHVYALLWRDDGEVSLRVVADQFEPKGDDWALRRSATLDVGDLPLEGAGAWSSDALDTSIQGALGLLLRQLAAHADEPAPAPHQEDPGPRERDGRQ